MDKSLKLKNTILSKYKSIREFSNSIGIPNSTLVSALDKGIGGMAVDKVIQICDALNIDIKTFDPLDITEKNMTGQEQSHIKKYRLLNENGQVKTDDYMDDLLKVDQYRACDKEEFSKPLAPDPDIDYDAAIEEAESEIARTPYARIAAYGGKNMTIKEPNNDQNNK